jgi:hypothetical protein
MIALQENMMIGLEVSRVSCAMLVLLVFESDAKIPAKASAPTAFQESTTMPPAYHVCNVHPAIFRPEQIRMFANSASKGNHNSKLAKLLVKTAWSVST